MKTKNKNKRKKELHAFFAAGWKNRLIPPPVSFLATSGSIGAARLTVLPEAAAAAADEEPFPPPSLTSFQHLATDDDTLSCAIPETATHLLAGRASSSSAGISSPLRIEVEERGAFAEEEEEDDDDDTSSLMCSTLSVMRMCEKTWTISPTRSLRSSL